MIVEQYSYMIRREEEIMTELAERQAESIWKRIDQEAEEKHHLIGSSGERIICECNGMSCLGDIPINALVSERWCPPCASAIAKKRILQYQEG